jgi:hypothetical protein
MYIKRFCEIKDVIKTNKNIACTHRHVIFLMCEWCSLQAIIEKEIRKRDVKRR